MRLPRVVDSNQIPPSRSAVVYLTVTTLLYFLINLGMGSVATINGFGSYELTVSGVLISQSLPDTSNQFLSLQDDFAFPFSAPIINGKSCATPVIDNFGCNDKSDQEGQQCSNGDVDLLSPRAYCSFDVSRTASRLLFSRRLRR